MMNDEYLELRIMIFFFIPNSSFLIHHFLKLLVPLFRRAEQVLKFFCIADIRQQRVAADIRISEKTAFDCLAQISQSVGGLSGDGVKMRQPVTPFAVNNVERF